MDSIFKYQKKGGKIIIMGLKDFLTASSIVIPKTIEGMPVTEISSYAFSSSLIADVKIGENIEVIGNNAFSGCKMLKSVVWNSKCNKIQRFCFYGYSNLLQFDFSNIKIIERCSFSRSGLQKIHLSPDVKEISAAAFSNCKSLHQVVWTCGCKEVPDHCFRGCSSLKQFSFSGIKKLEYNAFASSGLTSVTLNEGTEVGESCFADCNDLEKIEWLSDSSITEDIFEGCKNIKEVFVSDQVRAIERGAFSSSPGSEITFV